MELITGKKRQANFELLRIIAMFMVVTLHYLHSADLVLVPGMQRSAAILTGTAMESLCICAVNVYVLISGYFMSRSGFRPGKIVATIAQLWFYSVLIPVILVLAGVPIHGNNVWDAILYVLPVSGNHYWFGTAYVFLCLLSPLLNSAADRLSRRQLKTVIAGLLVFFCLIKSVCPVHLQTDAYGYDFGWFVCLYLIAAYIRRYGSGRIDTLAKAAALYFASAAGVFLLLFAVCEVNARTGALTYYASVPLHYNALLTLTEALGLFLCFSFITLPENGFASLVRKLAPYTFGVYLIHSHIDIEGRWRGWIEKLLGTMPANPMLLVLHILLCVLVVYAVCALIDSLRALLFKKSGHGLAGTAPAKWLRSLDDVFSEKNAGDKA